MKPKSSLLDYVAWPLLDGADPTRDTKFGGSPHRQNDIED